MAQTMAPTNRILLYIFILAIILLFLWVVTSYINPFIDRSSQTVAQSLVKTP